MEVALTKVHAALLEKLFGIADCERNNFAFRQAAAISAMQGKECWVRLRTDCTVAEQTRLHAAHLFDTASGSRETKMLRKARSASSEANHYHQVNEKKQTELYEKDRVTFAGSTFSDRIFFMV
jgi:hypothetical protein